MSSSTKPVLIGKVQATHGIKGQLRIVPFSGEVESFLPLRSVMIKSPAGKLETFEVTTVSPHGKRVLLRLKEFDNINQVLHLVGRELYVERSQLPKLPEGEFYWSDLLGMAVVTDLGESLGKLVDIIVTGSNDVYVVQGDKGEFLIPALEDVILEVDVDSKRMLVSPPEGLLDL
jgi:16S rRNA processing protein RimM